MSANDTVIVFDLDYTLWPFWVDTHFTPPFRKKGKDQIVDAHGNKIKYYPDVPEILQKLHSSGYQLGVASRTSETVGANQLLQLFDWDQFFKYKEIYPGCKVQHFTQIKKKSGVDYKNMIFFDDEERNIVDIIELGTTSILVKKGMTLDLLKIGLHEYKKKH